MTTLPFRPLPDILDVLRPEKLAATSGLAGDAMSGRAYRDLFPGAGHGLRRGRGAYMPPRMDDDMRRFMEMGRARILVAGIFMALVFTVVGGRLTQLAIRGESGDRPIAIAAERDEPRRARQYRRPQWRDPGDRPGDRLAIRQSAAPAGREKGGAGAGRGSARPGIQGGAEEA